MKGKIGKRRRTTGRPRKERSSPTNRLSSSHPAFKPTRCKAVVEAFRNRSKEEIIKSLAFEGQEKMRDMRMTSHAGKGDQMSDHPHAAVTSAASDIGSLTSTAVARDKDGVTQE
eukprot:4849504-Amphidinium_carterae.2